VKRIVLVLLAMMSALLGWAPVAFAAPTTVRWGPYTIPAGTVTDPGMIHNKLQLAIGDLDEFFDIGTWLIAIGGSLLLLLLYRAVIGRRSTGGRPVDRRMSSSAFEATECVRPTTARGVDNEQAWRGSRSNESSHARARRGRFLITSPPFHRGPHHRSSPVRFRAPSATPSAAPGRASAAGR
jgi:hypothetical protein